MQKTPRMSVLARARELSSPAGMSRRRRGPRRAESRGTELEAGPQPLRRRKSDSYEELERLINSRPRKKADDVVQRNTLPANSRRPPRSVSSADVESSLENTTPEAAKISAEAEMPEGQPSRSRAPRQERKLGRFNAPRSVSPASREEDNGKEAKATFVAGQNVLLCRGSGNSMGLFSDPDVDEEEIPSPEEIQENLRSREAKRKAYGTKIRMKVARSRNSSINLPWWLRSSSSSEASSSATSNAATPPQGMALPDGAPTLGDRVDILDKSGNRRHRNCGVLRYVGPTSFGTSRTKSGTRRVWAGIELDDPSGLNNGTVNGVCYFGPVQEDHGIFVYIYRVQPATVVVDVNNAFALTQGLALQSINVAHGVQSEPQSHGKVDGVRGPPIVTSVAVGRPPEGDSPKAVSEEVSVSDVIVEEDESLKAYKEVCAKETLQKYVKMLDFGVPRAAIVNKMRAEGVDERDCSVFETEGASTVAKDGYATIHVPLSNPADERTSSLVRHRKRVQLRAKTELKSVHWDTLDSSLCKDSIFSKRSKLSRMGVPAFGADAEDMTILYVLFAKPKGAPKSSGSHGNPKNGKKKEKKSLGLLSNKQEAQIGILLAALKGKSQSDGFVSIENELVSAILLFEPSAPKSKAKIDPDLLQSLEQVCPDAKEAAVFLSQFQRLEKRSQRSGGASVRERMSPQESFLLSLCEADIGSGVLVSVSRGLARTAARVQRFRCNFAYEKSVLASRLEVLTDACVALHQSEAVLRIFEVLLATGNALNGQEAPGFELSSLERLATTRATHPSVLYGGAKGFKEKVTVLDFVVYCMAHRGEGHLLKRMIQRLALVAPAARLPSLSQLRDTFTELRIGVQSAAAASRDEENALTQEGRKKKEIEKEAKRKRSLMESYLMSEEDDSDRFKENVGDSPDVHKPDATQQDTSAKSTKFGALAAMLEKRSAPEEGTATEENAGGIGALQALMARRSQEMQSTEEKAEVNKDKHPPKKSAHPLAAMLAARAKPGSEASPSVSVPKSPREASYLEREPLIVQDALLAQQKAQNASLPLEKERENFLGALRCFLASAEEDLQNLSADYDAAADAAKMVCVHFGELPADTEGTTEVAGAIGNVLRLIQSFVERVAEAVTKYENYFGPIDVDQHVAHRQLLLSGVPLQEDADVPPAVIGQKVATFFGAGTVREIRGFRGSAVARRLVVQLAWSIAYLSPETICSAGMRVRTKFGEGLVLSAYHFTAGEDVSGDGIGDHDKSEQVENLIKVELDWGAILFARAESCTLIGPGAYASDYSSEGGVEDEEADTPASRRRAAEKPPLQDSDTTRMWRSSKKEGGYQAETGDGLADDGDEDVRSASPEAVNIDESDYEEF